MLSDTTTTASLRRVFVAAASLLVSLLLTDVNASAQLEQRGCAAGGQEDVDDESVFVQVKLQGDQRRASSVTSEVQAQRSDQNGTRHAGPLNASADINITSFISPAGASAGVKNNDSRNDKEGHHSNLSDGDGSESHGHRERRPRSKILNLLNYVQESLVSIWSIWWMNGEADHEDDGEPLALKDAHHGPDGIPVVEWTRKPIVQKESGSDVSKSASIVSSLEHSLKRPDALLPIALFAGCCFLVPVLFSCYMFLGDGSDKPEEPVSEDGQT